MEVWNNALEQFKKNNNEDLTVFSEIPEICKTQACAVGIDEAGRGPVLGPMVYGIFCAVIDSEHAKGKAGPGDLPTVLNGVKKLNDSKQVAEKVRDELFPDLAVLEGCAFGLKFISPTQISSKCFRRQKNSLNQVSHDAAIELIQGLSDRGVKIAKVFVDTVGPMDKYQEKLQKLFPEMEFKVDTKADSKYKAVSAASICAKVSRDRALKEWVFPEGSSVVLEKGGWGSGYPADPTTKKFLAKNIDPVFGFPNIVRNSWSTAENLLVAKGVKVKWESETPDEAPAPKINKYFSAKKKDADEDETKTQPMNKPKSLFFTYRNLVQTVEL